jgi:chromate transporter
LIDTVDPSHPGEIGVLAQDVSLKDLFFAFFKISVRSWGGGSGTTYTMHQELVRRRWITSGQFALDFGLSRLIPGINLIALAVMTGYRLNGVVGSIVSTMAFMLPASLITVGITIAFVEVTSHAIGNAALRGVVPVTAALTFALALENANGVLPWRERRTALLMLAAVAASFVASAVFHLSVVFLIVGGAVIGACFFRPTESKQHP